MNLIEKIFNAFEVLNKTHENVEKLMEFVELWQQNGKSLI